MSPQRIQRKRTKGWKMPPNTVSVCRPGKYGNPFYIINEEGSPWITDARDRRCRSAITKRWSFWDFLRMAHSDGGMPASAA